MTLQTIYIARHGYRANWLPLPHPPNPTGIDSDPALAPHGVDQANELAKHIGSFPTKEKPQFILSSPFYRCVETSQPIAKGLGCKVHLDAGVGEWFKVDRKVVPKPSSYEQLGVFFPDVLGGVETWEGSGVVPSTSGETEEDIFERTKKFWAAFVPAFEKKHPKVTRILIVTHAASKIALGMSLMGFASVYDDLNFEGEKRIRSGACSLDKYQKKSGTWSMVQNGRTDFLKDGEEMNWNFDVKVEAGSDEDIKAREAAAKKQQQSNNPKKNEKELLEYEVRSKL